MPTDDAEWEGGIPHGVDVIAAYEYGGDRACEFECGAKTGDWLIELRGPEREAVVGFVSCDTCAQEANLDPGAEYLNYDEVNRRIE